MPALVVQNEAQRRFLSRVAGVPYGSRYNWQIGSVVQLFAVDNIAEFIRLGDHSRGYYRPAYAGEPPEPLPLPG